MTTWRPVPGYEGYYSVSDTGLVRRDKAAPHTRPGLILKPFVGASGYARVILSRENKQRKHTVHSLVARAFLGERLEGMTVNHIDGDKSNNRLVNLEWETPSGQSRHALSLDLWHPKPPHHSGEKNPAAKLTAELVRQIRVETGAAWRLAEKYGVSVGSIRNIRRGKTWQALA